METVVSGIRSTGKLHLGNYFGAVKNFVKMQQDNNC
ncbi:MAG TPA: tryptophan--tRNA ligase, partial [Flavobacteriales bacterium]|nr:tryptophan--tRNA ligase [Flavobacteriales bacterium]